MKKKQAYPFFFRVLLTLTYSLLFSTFVTATESVESPHLLKPGDVLNIMVFEHPELKLTVRVDSDGTIRFPLCGVQQAAGKTAGEIATVLEERLSAANIERAQVFVFISEYSPRLVYVLGEVNGANSMALEIPPERRLSALQAISHAGGFSEKADLRAVFILRPSSNRSVVRIPVDVSGIMARDTTNTDVNLKPGDTVMVPSAKPVLVLGMVNQPGSYYIDTSKAISVLEVISRAGGFSQRADVRHVTVLRQVQENERQEIVLDLRDKHENADVRDNTTVLPGDTVTVPEASPISVLGAVKSPGAFSINTSQTVSPLEMISRAGGFEEGAAQDRLVAVRTDADRTRTVIPVTLGASNSQMQNSQSQFLQPGDIVLAVPQEKVFVLGQVNDAGAFNLDPNHPLRITQAIAMAGGFNRLAAQKAILHIRDDKVNRLNLEEALRADGDLTVNRVLQPGDIVFVTESRW